MVAVWRLERLERSGEAGILEAGKGPLVAALGEMAAHDGFKCIVTIRLILRKVVGKCFCSEASHVELLCCA